MQIFQVTSTELKPVSETTFGTERIRERKDMRARVAQLAV
jgi:hypothetical protein